MIHHHNLLTSGIFQQIGLYETIEILIVIALVGLASIKPDIGSRAFERLERIFSDIAARPPLAALLIIGVAVAGRAALIPFLGTTQPVVADEGSLLLQAYTYLGGHLGNSGANLTPNFEAIYVISHPSYASMYPVLRSLPMVFGALIGVGFWGGIWISVILLCVMVYFIMRLWVAPAYALIAALIAVARLGFFSLWVNSYLGIALTALGGLLLIGGYARIRRAPTAASGALLGLGVFILMTTRPFEGMLFAAPIAIFLVVDFFRARAAVKRSLVVCGLVAGVFVAAGLALTAASDQAVTGSWRMAPYDLYRQTTASVPAFLIGRRTDPGLSTVRYDQVRRSLHLEDRSYLRRHSIRHVLGAEKHRLLNYWNFYIGSALLIPFLFGLFAMRGQLALLASLCALGVGLAFVTWDHSQYASPAFGVILLIEILGLRAMRRWAPRGRPVGLALSRLLPLAIIGGLAAPASTAIAGYPALTSFGIYGTAGRYWIQPHSLHEAVEKDLQAQPGGLIVFVDSGPRAPAEPTLVFNQVNIPRQRIIWVHDDPSLNAQTMAKYPGRQPWWLGWLADGSPCLTPYDQQFGAGSATADHSDVQPRGPCLPGLFRP